VYGVTQLHDVVYIVTVTSTILRFDATTHERLTDIDVKGLEWPHDIAACEQMFKLYVADEKCIWRVSADAADTQRWLPKSLSGTFKPESLSVTSTRLLVTSQSTCQLIQFDADGDELRSVQLPDDMRPRHAEESPTGTFVITQFNSQLKQDQVFEVNAGGEVLRQFDGSASDIAIDSRGNICAADRLNHRILLLSAHLSLRRIIIDEHQLNYKQPLSLCYREESGQLLIVMYGGSVAVFDVLRR